MQSNTARVDPGVFTWGHVGPLHLIDGIMRKKKTFYVFCKPIFPILWRKEFVFQQDGDPKQTAKIVKEWIGKQNFKLMEWSAQSTDPNPTEKFVQS